MVWLSLEFSLIGSICERYMVAIPMIYGCDQLSGEGLAANETLQRNANSHVLGKQPGHALR